MKPASLGKGWRDRAARPGSIALPAASAVRAARCVFVLALVVAAWVRTAPAESGPPPSEGQHLERVQGEPAEPVRDPRDGGSAALAQDPAGGAVEKGWPDSASVSGELRVTGDRSISTGDARRALGLSRAEGGLSREQATRALQLLGRRLLDDGFLEAELTLVLEREGGLRLHVMEGAEARWETLAIRLASPADTFAVAENRYPRPPREGIDEEGKGGEEGEPLPAGRFEGPRLERSLEELVDQWVDEGYPFAAAVVESASVHRGAVRVSVRFDPGPRLAVTEVVFPGRKSTRESFLRRWIRFRPGFLYRESQWQARQRRLEQTGLFSLVEAPRPEVTPEGLRVALGVAEVAHNRIEGALGYSGEARTLSGFADVELGNLFGTGRALGVRWERLRPKQHRLGLAYREPMLGPLPLGLALRLDQEVQDSTVARLDWEALVDAVIGVDLTAFGGMEYRRSLIGVEPSERTRRVSSVIGGRWDTIRPGTFRGGSLEASFRSGRSRTRPAGGGPTRSAGLNRAFAQAERYWRVRDPWTIRVAVDGGLLSRVADLPITEALRIGGSGSVRGYREEQFATQRHVTAQVEFGVATARNRIYAFVDGAWFRRFAVPASDGSAVSYGVGLAGETAARGVRLDLGFPRGAGLGQSRLHLRVQTRF